MRQVPTRRTWYVGGLVAAGAGSLFIVWLMGAVGILGVEGDTADLAYVGVLAVAFLGSLAVRLRPAGLVWVMALTVLLIGVVGGVAVLAGLHRVPHSSILEIGGLTMLLALPYAVASWCFRRAARMPSATRDDDG